MEVPQRPGWIERGLIKTNNIILDETVTGGGIHGGEIWVDDVVVEVYLGPDPSRFVTP